jgi:hypothetical protein
VNITNALELAFPSTPLDVNATVTNPILETDLGKYEDAFGRLRISDQYTLGDYKHVYFADDTYLDIVQNGATVTHIQNESSVQLQVTTTPGSSAIHQTRLYHHYQPGKSQHFKSSFVFGSPVEGLIRRSGVFDDIEGIYLEMNNDQFSWTIVNPNYTQTVVRSEWLDPLDGSGPSGVDLDFSKMQLLALDFQWLGVGRVRCGFVHDGVFILTVNFFHSNNFPSPFLRNPSLPVRCQLISEGGSGTMKQICATVVSEGGYSEVGRDFDATTGHVGRSCPVAGQRYPILAVRLKNTFKGLPNRVSLRLQNVSPYVETHGVLCEVWRLPAASSLTGTVVWEDVHPSSAAEYSVFPTGVTVTGALLVLSLFIAAGNPSRGNSGVVIQDPSKSRQMLLTQNFTSTDSEVFVIVFIPLGTSNNTGVLGFASMQWREVY